MYAPPKSESVAESREGVALLCCLIMGADLGSMLFDNDFLTLMAGKLTLKFGKLTYLCTRKNAKLKIN